MIARNFEIELDDPKGPVKELFGFTMIPQGLRVRSRARTGQPQRASGGVRSVPVRVLFTSMSAQSHIAPMLPLARAAARVGHDVVFATGPDAVAQVQAAGLQALPAGLSFIEVRRRYAQASGSELAGLSPQERLEHLLLHGLIGIAAPAMLDDLLPFASTWQPGLVIRNLGEPAAEVLATATGVPHVIHGFSSPKSSYFATAHRAGLAELYEGCGIDPPSGDSRLATPYLDIWPEGLHPQAEDWQYPNMWPLRPENAIPLTTPPPRPAALDCLPFQRTVYVTAGTTHNSTPGLLETMVAALHDEAVNVVVTIGPDGDLDLFGTQPEHVRIERYIPQNTLLPHCDVVLCSTGAGTVLRALAPPRHWWWRLSRPINTKWPRRSSTPVPAERAPPSRCRRPRCARASSGSAPTRPTR